MAWFDNVGSGVKDQLYGDPFSFIMTSLEKDYPWVSGASGTRQQIASQSSRLQAIADMISMINPYQAQGAAGLYNQLMNYTAQPSSQFVGNSPGSALGLVNQARPALQKQYEANSADGLETAFNTLFRQLAQVVGGGMSPGMQSTMFSRNRQDLERAAYANAIANGTNQDPMSFLGTRGYLG